MSILFLWDSNKILKKTKMYQAKGNSHNLGVVAKIQKDHFLCLKVLVTPSMINQNMIQTLANSK